MTLMITKRVLFRQKSERGYSVSDISWRRLFISLGLVTVLIRARYFGGYKCSGGPT